MATGLSAQTSQPADYIVAIVNTEPVTNNEVRLAVGRLTQEYVRQRQTPPAAAELRRIVLERLINDRVQMQEAVENTIRIEDAAVDLAEQNVARQNQIDVAELRIRVAKDGITPAKFRAELRDQLTLQRLYEREVEGRIRITENDIDRHIAEQEADSVDPMAQEINLAHLLISLSEKASTEQANAVYLQAQKVQSRLRAGEDFGALVLELSAADRSNGGQMGLRRADRYPPAFVSAIQALPVGGVSDIVRTGAGYHFLKVVDHRAAAVAPKGVVQSHARHILLRPGPELSQQAAVARMIEFRKRLESGAASFESLAREFSQDGSAPQGGDLGWVAAGAFVPEFEESMNRLAEGQVSGPVVSRFGVHLIQLLERRRVELSQREIRETIRAKLKETKYEAAFKKWSEELRSKAFVEFRDPPQ